MVAVTAGLREISEHIPTTRFVDPSRRPRANLLYPRLSQAGAHQPGNASDVRATWFATSIGLCGRCIGNFWRLAFAARTFHTSRCAIAGDRNVRGHCKGTQRSRDYGRA